MLENIKKNVFCKELRFVRIINHEREINICVINIKQKLNVKANTYIAPSEQMNRECYVSLLNCFIIEGFVKYLSSV